MASLLGRSPKDSFKELLTINNNGGLNDALHELGDGKGSISPLSLSLTQISLNGVTWPTTAIEGAYLRVGASNQLEWAALTTSDVAEGNNLYFTVTRGRALFTGVGDIFVDQTTGEISYTGTGAQGPQGDTGPQGPQGIQGEIGPQGPAGDKGDTGPAGADGLPGPQGEQGIQGIQGPAGADGLPGIQGSKGDKGDSGADGLPGTDGAVGPQGPKGDKGDPGTTTGDVNTDFTAKNLTVSGSQSVGGNLNIGGNLNVTGTVTTVNSEVITTASNILAVNTGEPGAGVSSGTAGMSIDRGTLPDAQFLFNEADKTFKAGIIGSLETVATRPWASGAFAPLTHVGSGDTAHATATSSVAGFMSPADKAKLDSLSTTAGITQAAADARYMKLTGGSLTGSLILAGDATVAMGAATKQQVDAAQAAAIAASLPRSGGTVTSLTVTNTINGSISGNAATATNVTGVVSLANGGTGATNAAQALINLGAVSLVSPAFSGNPTAPTQATTDSSTRLATTAYVKNQGFITSSGTAGGAPWSGITGRPNTLAGYGITDSVSTSTVIGIGKGGTGATTAAAGLAALGGAPLASPALTGSPTSTTAPASDNSTRIATTAFVKSQGYLTGAMNDANAIIFTDSNNNIRTFVNFSFSGTVSGAGPGGRYVPSTLAIGGTSGYQSTISMNSNYSNSIIVSSSGLVLNGQGSGVYLQNGGTTVLTANGSGVQVAGTLTATTVNSTFNGALTGNVTGNVTGNLLGTPNAPTPASTDNSTKVATTAYVKGQGFVSAGSTLGTTGQIPYVTATNAVSGTGNFTYRLNYGAGPGGVYSDSIINFGTSDSMYTHLNLGGTNMAPYGYAGEAWITSGGALTLRSTGGVINLGVGNTNYVTMTTTNFSTTLPFSAPSFSGAGTGLTGTAASLSIGGNAATATTATTATTVSSIIPVNKGGTGVGTLTGYVKGAGTANMTASATIPFSDVTGTVGISQGGTGATTAAAGLAALGGAPLASPALTGTPTAPTATAGTNTTQLATTAFVTSALANVGAATSATKLATARNIAGVSFDGTADISLGVSNITGAAPLASPALTGTPTAPTATAGTNSTQLATTAFVTSALSSLGSLTNAQTAVTLVDEHATSMSRFVNPGGAYFGGNNPSVSGAIKIKFPLPLPAASMIQMTVKIFEYAGASATAGNSRTLVISGFTIDGTTNWNFVAASQQTVGGGDINVRFGKDATSHCIWIGETNQAWSFPQVAVTDVQVGYANGQSSIWASGWSITFATSYDTVYLGPTVAAKNVTSQNVASYAPSLTGTGASGTWGIGITGNAATATALTSTLNVAGGGTGATTLTGLVYGNGTSAMTAATGAQIATAIGTNSVTNATNVTGTVSIANGGTGATTAAAAVIALGIPYDLAGMILGKPTASSVVLRFITPRAFTVPAAMAGSIAKSAVSATAATVLNVQKNNSTFGTITFAAGSSTGTFAAASSTNFAIGDVFTVVAPGTQDATFADCEFTIVANLI